jgi:hypothetical protein
MPGESEWGLSPNRLGKFTQDLTRKSDDPAWKHPFHFGTSVAVTI